MSNHDTDIKVLRFVCQDNIRARTGCRDWTVHAVVGQPRNELTIEARLPPNACPITVTAPMTSNRVDLMNRLIHLVVCRTTPIPCANPRACTWTREQTTRLQEEYTTVC